MLEVFNIALQTNPVLNFFKLFLWPVTNIP